MQQPDFIKSIKSKDSDANQSLIEKWHQKEKATEQPTTTQRRRLDWCQDDEDNDDVSDEDDKKLRSEGSRARRTIPPLTLHDVQDDDITMTTTQAATADTRMTNAK